MRQKFAAIAAVFVPIGFIGGLIQGSIGLGIGSAFIWLVIFLVVKHKS